MEFEFINRIWTNRMGKGRWRKRILLGLGLAILLLTVIQVIMEGFAGVNWVINGFVPLLLIGIGLMGDDRGGYITAACLVSVRNNGLTITYPAVDYQDNKGQRREVQTIRKEDICLIQYSSTLVSFRIICNAGSVVPLQAKEKVVLYPRPEQIKDMMAAFTSVLGIQVSQMDSAGGE